MKPNIKDLAPLLANLLIDHEIDTSLFADHKKLVADNAARLGTYSRYIGFLHDSRVIQTRISPSFFSVTLNDYATWVFAQVVAEKMNLKIPYEKLRFPVQFKFKCSELGFYKHDDNGKLQKIRAVPVDEYLYEQIISIDEDSISLMLVFWTKGVRRKSGSHVLVLLHVRAISSDEGQDEAWKQLFGDRYDPHYQYFRSQVSGGRGVYDMQDSLELYNEVQ